MPSSHLGASDIIVSRLCYGGRTLCPILQVAYRACLSLQPWEAAHVQPSCITAGTMLFGESTAAAEASVLLHTAAELGINFFDSAEMYPVPQSASTQGLSEVILGKWLKSQRR